MSGWCSWSAWNVAAGPRQQQKLCPPQSPASSHPLISCDEERIRSVTCGRLSPALSGVLLKNSLGCTASHSESWEERKQQAKRRGSTAAICRRVEECREWLGAGHTSGFHTLMWCNSCAACVYWKSLCFAWYYPRCTNAVTLSQHWGGHNVNTPVYI